jgi:hypothetical protein
VTILKLLSPFIAIILLSTILAGLTSMAAAAQTDTMHRNHDTGAAIRRVSFENDVHAVLRFWFD